MAQNHPCSVLRGALALTLATLTAACLLVAACLLSVPATAQEPPTPWRNDPLFQRLAAALDPVLAIDNHTHLLRPGEFDPARAAMVERLGERGYWTDHLDYTRTEIALVNSYSRPSIDDERFRWVRHASTLLYPLPADHLRARSPNHEADIVEMQNDLQGLLTEAGLAAVPADVAAYVRFLDETLSRWRKEGVVGVKFFDAYLRTLRIADVAETRAAQLYAKGRTAPLARDDYLALQDFLWRHILLEAGKLSLPVHIHSSLGVPPFLRSLESDVRSLEDVLADPKFFATPIVLIHGGFPWHEITAYLALKPNVWVDVSSRGFINPVPDFAAILRQHLLFAPEKVLFGTDAASVPSWPGGDDVHHLVVSRATRDALYLALAGLVRDGVVDHERAVEMGPVSERYVHDGTAKCSAVRARPGSLSSPRALR